MGTQRVSSAMYLQHHQALASGYSPAVTTELGDLVTGFGLDWELVEVLEEPLDLSVVISQKDYEAEIIECGTDACRCEVSPYWAKVLYDIDCDDIRIHYCWSVAEIPQEAAAGLREYHPDYASAKLSTGLGNTEFITNASGRAHQFFFYSPWGEALEVHSAQFGYNSPYRFNSKEWDEETGNYYYGARYYDPKASVWLSVDPLAHDYPSLSPYAFVANNPVMLYDPDGKKIKWNLDGIFVAAAMMLTKTGRENLRAMRKDEFTTYKFRLSNAVGVSKSQGAWGVVEGQQYQSAEGECLMIAVVYLGTYRLKRGAEKRYGQDSHDIDPGYLELYAKRYLRKPGVVYERIEDYGENTAREYDYVLGDFDDLNFLGAGSRGYDDYSLENESRTNYIGRVGTHETTHALIEAGAWNDPSPSNKEAYPQERERMWQEDRSK